MSTSSRRPSVTGGVLVALIVGLGSLLGLSMTAAATADDAAIEARELWQERPARVIGLEVVEFDDDGRPEISHVDWVFSETRARKVIEESDGEVSWAVPMEIQGVPDDPLWNHQWAMRVVDAPAAWPTADGSGITVAVIDTGVLLTHPDLVGQLVPGRDIIADDDDPNDEHGHGTHVAGIIAAASNNQTGIAGAAPGTRIMPVRVLDSDGEGTSWHVAQGIIWAVDNGADVINLSLGGRDSLAVSEAVRYAIDNDVVVVAAAGNNGHQGNVASWPGADPNSLAVAAIDSSLRTASFSTRGSYIDVAAPGSRIVSTWMNNGYAYLSGTSMATPYVAAIAAAVRQNDPTLSELEVRNRITSTAIDLLPVGKDTTTGHGLATFPAALGLLETWSADPPSEVTAAVNYKDLVITTASSPATNLLGYQYERNGQVVALTTSRSLTERDLALTPAEHTYTVRAVSTAGTSGTPQTRTMIVDPPPAPTVSATSVGSVVDFSLSPSTGATRWFVYRDGVLIWAPSTAPTSFSLHSQPTGTRTYTVRASSPSGTSAFSDPVTLAASTTTTTTTTTPVPAASPEEPPPAQPSGDGFVGVTPARLADTRPGGRTIDNTGPAHTLTANTTLDIQITGRGNIPTNATAAALNVTVVNPTQAGYLTVYPCGATRPDASNLNYTAGQTIPNSVLTRIGTNGRICVYTDQTTDLIIDINGHFTER